MTNTVNNEIRQKTDEEMYCCPDFKVMVENGDMSQGPDGKWCIMTNNNPVYYTLYKMAFCLRCGKEPK